MARVERNARTANIQQNESPRNSGREEKGRSFKEEALRTFYYTLSYVLVDDAFFSRTARWEMQV